MQNTPTAPAHTPRPRRMAWAWALGLGFTGLMLVAAGQPPLGPQGSQPAGPQLFPNGQPGNTVPTNSLVNLPGGQQPQQLQPAQPQIVFGPDDTGGRLLQEARTSFSRVRDYVGTLVKQERVKGQLLPEQVAAFRMRTQPFSVYMKWSLPKAMADQEACFVAGKNNNQMRVRQAGPLKALGFMSIDPRDPRAMATNRHAITEAGLGNLIERLITSHAKEAGLPNTQVQTRFADYMFQQRPCTRMETFHLVNNGQFFVYRSVVYFDKEMRLPIRTESYDWPVAGGNPGGELLECYSYVDLKFNVGLTDGAFNY